MSESHASLTPRPDASIHTEEASCDAEVFNGFSLTVVAGPDAGARFVSRGSRFTLGTHASANGVLRDPTVSRFHCEIEIVPGRARIKDLSSRNGCRVDGVPVLDAYLRNGAVLGVGRTQLRFEVSPETFRLPRDESERFGTMIGRSIAIRRTFAALRSAASSDATVLLEGETGTGKEIAAESVHSESARRDKPFLILDCSAIPRDLLESELFGHEKGAFTGATAERDGIFEAADGGTVFLDEIGELALDLQPKLLRVLERRAVRRVGANHFRNVDVRVIAATNRDLRAEVNARRFRSDLYYRLAVLQVSLPPLRDRLDDVPVLVEHLLETLGVSNDAGAALVRTPAFLEELRSHSWAGNVRELRNYVERALAFRALPVPASLGGDAEPEIVSGRSYREAREAWTSRFEREYLEQMLSTHDGNVRAAARAARLDRARFYRLLWKHGLR